MPKNPEIEEFEREIRRLDRHAVIASHTRKGEVHLGALTLEEVAALLKESVPYYFLIAAAGLNRTSLKRAMLSEEAQIVQKELRRAFAVKEHLPVRRAFSDVVNGAVVLRKADLNRRARGAIESLFRERLKAEGIPILMSPPVRQVPGILIGKRKPDGVYPDPMEDKAPAIYLEIKNVRRVSDDIQKRLYEVAEASLEMKILYGDFQLEGFGLKSTQEVLSASSKLRAKLRRQILAAQPTVVVILLCSREEAERYREGAEAFIDRVFFQEEVEECLSFLKRAVKKYGAGK